MTVVMTVLTVVMTVPMTVVPEVVPKVVLPVLHSGQCILGQPLGQLGQLPGQLLGQAFSHLRLISLMMRLEQNLVNQFRTHLPKTHFFRRSQ